MAKGMQWEKRARQERVRVWDAEHRHVSAAERAAKSQHRRSKAIANFVEANELSCFVCGATRATWAKSGVSSRGPWVICVPCVRKPKDAA